MSSLILFLLFATGVADTSRFTAGVIDTGGKFAAGIVVATCKDTGGASLLAIISANYQKKSK